MICCLCGRRIEEGEYFFRITFHRWFPSDTGDEVLTKEVLEDGSKEKRMCPTCPVMSGAPLDMVGGRHELDV